jgi:hypothetical protein
MVTGAWRISVPDELAETLVVEGVAVRPLLTRGGAVSEVIHFLVDGVNTGASVVTVGVATGGLYKLSQRLARFLHRDAGAPTRVTFRGPHGERTVPIDRSRTEPEIAATLLAALHAVSGGDAKPPD